MRCKKSTSPKYLNGQFILRDAFDIENSTGYLKDDDDSSKYLGNKHHIYSKFQASYNKTISFGYTTDKDPGEPFLTNEQKSFDFHSAYAMYQGDNWLKTLIIGDYHANFGQGLALWTGTNMGIGSDVLQNKQWMKLEESAT